jgi:hypothetical protein
VRYTKSDLRSQIKQNLSIEFAPQGITAFGGLELIRRYFSMVGLHRRVRSAFAKHDIGGDYRCIDMILVVIALLLAGGSRMDHIAHLGADPLVKRFCGLMRLPDERSISRWLKRFTMQSMQALIELNSQIAAEAIEREHLGRLTIDVDGTVLTTGSSVAWSFRGFNPHKRKHHSYYPIIAHLAQTGHILRVKNRPGNVHDSTGAESFIRELIDDLDVRLPRKLPMEFRMDGAFFQKEILSLLERRKAFYAIKVPFMRWLKIIPIIRERKRWHHLSNGIGYFEIELDIPCWQRSLRVVIYRKRVPFKSRKNYQLDLFDPADGHFEYSAVATNRDIQPAFLWQFMAGRGAQEKTIAELKGEWAFDTIPTNHYAANTAWQQVSVLGHNLIRSFQIETMAGEKRFSIKRTYHRVLHSLKTIRFLVIHQPARIVRPQGYGVLKFSVAPETEAIISNIDNILAA